MKREFYVCKNVYTKNDIRKELLRAAATVYYNYMFFSWVSVPGVIFTTFPIIYFLYID